MYLTICFIRLKKWYFIFWSVLPGSNQTTSTFSALRNVSCDTSSYKQIVSNSDAGRNRTKKLNLVIIATCCYAVIKTLCFIQSDLGKLIYVYISVFTFTQQICKFVFIALFCVEKNTMFGMILYKFELKHNIIIRVNGKQIIIIIIIYGKL